MSSLQVIIAISNKNAFWWDAYRMLWTTMAFVCMCVGWGVWSQGGGATVERNYTGTPVWTAEHVRKHYLPTTSFAGGINM